MSARDPDGRENRIHVMHVYSRLNVGGIEHQILNVLPRLNNGRYRASLCLIKSEGAQANDLRKRGIPIYVVPLRGRLGPSSLARLGWLFRSTRTRIVHAHVRESNTSATVSARLALVPVVIGTIHSMNKIQGMRRILQDRTLARCRDTTIAVSESVKANYCRAIGVDPSRVTVIYNGVDLARFTGPDVDRAQVLDALGVDPGDRVVACVARMASPKSHHILLAAAARVLRSAPRTTFLLVGDGPLTESLQAQARSLGISSKVVFAGARDDVPRILCACDASALTSNREGFSIVVIESLAAGLPVVATDVGGNAEAIEEGVSGFLLPVGDVEGIADRLTRLVLDEALRSRMSEAARRRSERFSLDETVRATEALYDRLLRARGIDPPVRSISDGS